MREQVGKSLIRYVDNLATLGEKMSEGFSRVAVANVDRLADLGEVMTYGLPRGVRRIWRHLGVSRKG